MKSNLVFLLVAIFLISGCAHVASRDNIEIDQDLSLGRIESLNIGKTNFKQVVTLFGEPVKAVTLKNGDLVWFYLNKEKSFEKASFLFSPGGSLKNMTWTIGSAESERNIKILRNRYPSANFKERKNFQDFGHFFTTDFYLEDNRLGVSISLNQDKSAAESISWFDPTARVVAQSKSGKFHVFHDPDTGLVTKIPLEDYQP